VHLHGGRYVDEDLHLAGWSAAWARSACPCRCPARRCRSSCGRSRGGTA
jgi:hypothetical protein